MKTEYVHYLYYTLLYTLYALYIITILNLAYFKSVTVYLPFIQDGLKYFVILFLLIRFNPYTNDSFTAFDKKNNIFIFNIFVINHSSIRCTIIIF